MPSPTQITIAQLSRLIGMPEAPLSLDVRTDEDFADDPRLLPAALRHPFNTIQNLAADLKTTRVVVYCQKGKKLSEGSAAVLRSEGVNAETLQVGHFGWRDARQLLIPTQNIPNYPKASIWVTRHRPKIDRIACPWLIRRFVDPRARFLFVAPSEVITVAEHFVATPFDMENVHFSHRGDQCTFDTMLEEFQLHNESLDRFATIVRGADTNRLELTPQCAGLLAASLGFSRLYDALYRWCRDATDETHDWPV